ncbi:uncharacterized protein LOC135213367 [Macrobrachium nipponense]|uniref:uncharacterized protein LOC135213367 n=1 Tax=Macrobrachium nipponense TaxID=159736 RepID=UPI0030C84A15
MGHCVALDVYTKSFDDVIENVARKYKCIDDTLLYDMSVEQVFWYLFDFLEVCEKHGITLNPSKFKFCKREVKFVGYQVGWDTYQPTADRLSAVKDFPMPSELSITDIRAWHGLVNQLAPFMATAPVMAPFGDLLKKPSKKKNYWDDQAATRIREGCPNLTLFTDHGPLVNLFGNRELKDISNPRLFRLKEKTLQYHFSIKYLPGKRNCAAEILSRYPSLRAKPEDKDLELSDDLKVAMVMSLAAALEVEDVVVMDQETVLRAARDDPVYQLLLTRVYNGDWPQSKSQELECLKPFCGAREWLAVSGELITYTYDQGCVRLVIPESLRQQVAANMHSGHQGLESMLRWAHQSVYWSDITGDLEHQRAKCQVCETYTPSQQQEHLIITPPPEYPFQQLWWTC